MPDASLREHVAQWKAAGAAQWGQLALARDPLVRLFSEEQKAAIVTDAIACGLSQAETFRQRYGTSDAPVDAPSAFNMAARMGIRISAHNYPIGENRHILFAQYENREITIAEGIVNKINQLMDAEALWPLLERFDPVAAIITHELYHCLEDENPGILTRKMNIPVKTLKIFTQKVTPIMAGEIAAFAFSQALCGWTYHARIVELLGIWSCNPELAKALTVQLMACPS